MALDSSTARAVADAVGRAVRAERQRPPSDRGGMSLQAGTVQSVNVDDDYVDVIVDGDNDPIACQAVADVVDGDRVTVLFIPPAGAIVLGSLGSLGTTSPPLVPVTGSRGGNAALASLLTALESLGWITDNTTP